METYTKEAENHYKAWSELDNPPMLYVGDVGNNVIMYIRDLKKFYVSAKGEVEGTIADVQTVSTLFTRELVTANFALHKTRNSLGMLNVLAANEKLEGAPPVIPDNSGAGMG